MLKVICENGAKVFGRVINMINGVIELTKDEFEKKKQKYLNNWGNSHDPKDDINREYYKIIPRFIDDDDALTIEDNKICIDTPFWDKDEKDAPFTGFIRLEIPITPDIAATIIDLQVKKYNKVKTMLEATK